MLVERLAAFVLMVANAARAVGGVQNLEQLPQPRTQVRAIGCGALFNESAKRLRRLKDAGVVCKQAKQQPHQQYFKRVAGVAAGFQRIVQPPHALGGLDVDRVLRLDGLRLVARHKAKQLDVFVQVFECKLNRLAGGQPVYPKARKVADDDDLRQVPFGQARKVRQCLHERGVQIFATRLLLHQQHAGPEQIDKTVRFGL